MATEHPRMLAEAERAFLIAPAGCGKTYAIAATVALNAEPLPQLVLTHTHAGVHALEAKLRSLKVPTNRYRVYTLANWALRYSTSYPAMCGFSTAADPRDWASLSQEEYDMAYGTAARLLQRKTIQDVIRSTYSGVYVDEYQDCTVSQAGLVMELASLIPCRILGDPLQGIFDFAGPLADMDELKGDGFLPLPPLVTPMRWTLQGNNLKLGEWLTSIRAQFENKGQPIDIGKYHESLAKAADPFACCRERLKGLGGSVVIILDQQPQCHNLARRLGYRVQSIEEIHSKELVRHCREIDEADLADIPLYLAKFAGCCLSGLGQGFERSVGRYFREGKLLVPLKGQPALLAALTNVAADGSPCLIQSALEAFYRTSKDNGGRIFRSDLWSGMRWTLRARQNASVATFEEAAIQTRRELAQVGRRLPKALVSTTLLVKGLEFDHAIVFAEGLDRRNLYVAITRASKSLTIISKSQVIPPAKSSAQGTLDFGDSVSSRTS